MLPFEALDITRSRRDPCLLYKPMDRTSSAIIILQVTHSIIEICDEFLEVKYFNTENFLRKYEWRSGEEPTV